MSIPRLHLFELADQPWFPSTLRTKIQDILTELWTWELPGIQTAPPASLAVHTLRDLLGSGLSRYTFVDLCAGGGGPTPFIEDAINSDLNPLGENGHVGKQEAGHKSQAKETTMQAGSGSMPVDFILTDLHPHLQAWRNAVKASKSQHLRYMPISIDATNVSKQQILGSAEPAFSDQLSRRTSSTDAQSAGMAVGDEEKRIFRMFNLSFHHFDDDLAIKILKSTLETSEGFGIFELQGRDLGSIFMALLMWPILVLGSYGWYWGEWPDFFLHGILPIIPTIIAFDAVVSCLRTRTNPELNALLQDASEGVEADLEDWKIVTGEKLHTWPLGKMRYYIGIKS